MSPLMQTFSLSSFWSGNPVRCTIYKCLLLLSKRVDGTPSLTFAHWVKVDIIVVATVFSPYLNSAFSSFFLASFPSVAPSLISELRAEKIEQKSITLVWREPSHPNSSRTGYEVKYYEKVYVLLLHHKYQLNSVLFVEEGGKKHKFYWRKWKNSSRIMLWEVGHLLSPCGMKEKQTWKTCTETRQAI